VEPGIEVAGEQCGKLKENRGVLRMASSWYLGNISFQERKSFKNVILVCVTSRKVFPKLFVIDFLDNLLYSYINVQINSWFHLFKLNANLFKKKNSPCLHKTRQKKTEVQNRTSKQLPFSPKINLKNTPFQYNKKFCKCFF